MDGFIYVATSPSGLVKIGHSTNPERRVGALRSPLGERASLLFYFESPVQLERTIHEGLRREHSVSGEWYPSTVRDLFRHIQVILNETAADRMHWALQSLLRESHKQIVQDLTDLTVEAYQDSCRLDVDRAAAIFARRGREVATAINDQIEVVLRPAARITETVRFVDPHGSEKALSP